MRKEDHQNGGKSNEERCGKEMRSEELNEGNQTRTDGHLISEGHLVQTAVDKGGPV